MQKTTAMQKPAIHRNNIIAIASGKGGVGKTWLSITLAHAIARSGRHVLLFDGDIGLANVDVQLGLMPNKDLNSVFFNGLHLQEAITHYKAGGFDIIAGRSGAANLSALSLSKVQAIKEDLLTLAGNYDYVLIDLGAGIEQYVQFLSSIAAQCMVVVTDEPTSLTDAYAFIKFCVSNPHAPDISIVVNQAASQKEGEGTYAALNKACTSFLNLSPPCLGIIRKDGKVKDSIRQQSALLTKAPHCTAASDVAALSVKLMQKPR